jgi:hypothetical protein
VLMDCHCLAVWLGLPECRVIHQVLGPPQLALPRERRDHPIVCPQCGTCCSRVKASRPRCLRDWPILEHPVMLWRHLRRFECPDGRYRPWETRETFGERTQWTQRLYHQVRAAGLRGCPGHELARRSGRAARTVCRWTLERSRGGRPRQLGRAIGIDA